MSPAGYSALRDATPWGHDVFNPFDVEDPGLALSGSKVVQALAASWPRGVASFRTPYPQKVPGVDMLAGCESGMQRPSDFWKTGF